METYAYLLYTCCNISRHPTDEALLVAGGGIAGLSALAVKREGRGGEDPGEEELATLVSDMLATAPGKAAGWVAGALYAELKGEKDKAMLFVDKVRIGGPSNSACVTSLLFSLAHLLSLCSLKRPALVPTLVHPTRLISRQVYSSRESSRNKPLSPSHRPMPSRRTSTP
jgi:hypothetical protein